MKKPERMTGRLFDGEGAYESGYNQACNDWEKFLPSIREIEDLLDNLYHNDQISIDWNEVKIIAKAIAKRIGKDNEKDETEI